MTHDLRTIKRLKNDNWIVVRMSDLKENDIFQMFESNGEQVKNTWIATSDAYPDVTHEGLFAIDAKECWT